MPQDEGDFPKLKKELVRNLIPDLTADNGPVLEKVEGLMVTAKGDAFIVTDNDGVDESSGETQEEVRQSIERQLDRLKEDLQDHRLRFSLKTRITNEMNKVPHDGESCEGHAHEDEA